MSSSQSPSRAHFATEELRHELFNFHRVAEIDLVESVLSLQPDRAPALLLIGESGIGKKYLLQSVVLRRRKAGTPLRLVTIDLQGFEPNQGESSFADYLEHLAAKNNRPRTRRWREFVRWVAQSKLKLTVRTGALASVALESDLSLEKLASLLKDDARVSGPLFVESEAFFRQLSVLAGENPLLVHLDDLDAAPSILIDWLLRLPNRQQGFYLAFSTSSLHHLPVSAPCTVVEISPLDREEIRTILDTRFSPNSFPEYICNLLHQYSKGWPSLVAAKMGDMVNEGLVTCGPTDVWGLDEAATEQALAASLSDSILDWFQRTVSAAPLQWRSAIRQTVQLACLCGWDIPIVRLAEFEGHNALEQQELLETIDQVFGSGGLFVNHEFSHPGFLGELIYSFVNPIVPHALREGMRLSDREQLSIALIKFFSDRIPRHTRSQIRLYLELASAADHTQLSNQLRLELSWFAGIEDLLELTAMLRSKLLCGEVDPAVLIEEELQNRDNLTPQVRLAVLESLCEPSEETRASKPAYVPLEVMPTFLTSHAIALLDAGLYESAYERASEALAISGGDDETALLKLRGECSYQLGDYRSALDDFRTAIGRWGGGGVPNLWLLSTKSSLGACMHALGDYEKARQVLSEVLEAETALLGANDNRTLSTKNNLAAVLRSLGDHQTAHRLFSELLDYQMQTLGRDHPDTVMAMGNLGATLRSLGDYEEAKTLESQVVALRIAIDGPEHPRTLIARANLAECLLNLGGDDSSYEMYLELLPLSIRVLGPEHPDTLRILLAHARGLRNLGNTEAAKQLLAEVLEKRIRLLGPEHPDTLEVRSELELD